MSTLTVVVVSTGQRDSELVAFAFVDVSCWESIGGCRRGRDACNWDGIAGEIDKIGGIEKVGEAEKAGEVEEFGRVVGLGCVIALVVCGREAQLLCWTLSRGVGERFPIWEGYAFGCARAVGRRWVPGSAI